MSRTRLNLNREWKFCRGDSPESARLSDAHRTDFDDSAWQNVGLPHTFDLPYFRTPEFYVGFGWYRRQFVLTPSPRTRGEGWGEGSREKDEVGRMKDEEKTDRILLEFNGAFQVTDVYVNGNHVGRHEGGYTGFCFDITGASHEGENLLAVRVNNEWSPRIAPRAGEHIFCGGLYRDVHLVTTDALHITWHGAYATAIVDPELTIATVTIEIQNDSSDTRQFVLWTRILDPHGAAVSMSASKHSIRPGQRAEFNELIEPIRQPLLWHPDHPHLYTIQVEIHAGDVLVDSVEFPFGFRWFHWTPHRGFFLNGEHLYLRGANAHQDHSGWGIAITRAACERDVRLIKEAGFNFVRGAHYPHHPAFAEACDRLGLLYWSENCFWGKGGFGPEGYWNASAFPIDRDDFAPFGESCKQTLREMIRTHRNHPSIIAWSMTNEAFFTYNLDDAKQLMRELVALSHELDPTRPAAIGGAQRGDVDKIGDIAGYNGDGARLFIDPGVPNMVSEYGAISKPHDAFDPFFGELQREQFPWRAGEAIWAGFDYGSIAGRQGLKGIVDHARVPKRSWYWYRNEYRGIAPPEFPQAGTPAKLSITADKTTIRGTDATDDCQLIVTVLDHDGRHISNCPVVTLTIESGPGEFPTGRSITFDAETDIKIVEGQSAIAFRSYDGGETAIRATSPGLEDASVVIRTEGSPGWEESGRPLAFSRRYAAPVESEAARRAMNNAVNVALNRPCRASSEAELHPARLANDGNPSTSWQADEPLASWTGDLEGFYQLASLRLTFGDEGNFRFVVELSNDSSGWTVAIDRSQSGDVRAARNDVFSPGAIARYVRIRFVEVPNGARAHLSEVEVQGVLSVR